MLDIDALILGPTMAIFGEDRPPLYQPGGGRPSFPLASAVFDREYQVVSLSGDGSENTTARPVLGVRLSLFPAPPMPSDTVFIPSVGLRYAVREVQPDGHGHAKLMLNVVEF